MHGYTSNKIDVLSCSSNGSSFHIDIAFGKKEFAYAFVLQINCTCIFFVLLRLRGHTLILSSGGSGNLKLPLFYHLVKV